MIEPALTYTPCPDLWGVTAYFNPAHYRTRRANYAHFAAPIRAAGIPLLTVEHAVGDAPFELPPGPDVLQVRGPDVLWQKERLINLGVAHLPPDAARIAWLDGDIRFTNPDWAVTTARLLDDYPVVQPFARAIRLRRGCLVADGTESAADSFAATVACAPDTLQRGTFYAHGHTGFAWAGRREWLAQYAPDLENQRVVLLDSGWRPGRAPARYYPSGVEAAPSHPARLSAGHPYVLAALRAVGAPDGRGHRPNRLDAGRGAAFVAWRRCGRPWSRRGLADHAAQPFRSGS
jgi:hypothetical protein